MGPKSEPGPTLFRTFFPATIAVACLANLVILLIRLYFTVHHSDLFETSGTEGVGIYAVWKAKNGYPLYEWPDSGAFAMSIFNYLLYTMDGFLLRVFHIADNHVPSMARLITFAFAVGGVFAHRAVVRQIMPKALCNRAVSITAWLLIVSMWIGRSSVSWWTLTVRPDIPALALDVIGLLFLIRSMEGKSIINTLTASVLFYLAWSMKQSFVLTISISCLFLLVSRRYRETLWLCVPFAAMCAVTLVIGGPVFRRNMLYMPTLAPFGLRSGLVNLATWVVFNPIFWMPACFLPWAWRGVAGRITPGQAQPRFDDRRRLMLIVMLAAISLPLSFVASCRVGANYNYFFVPLVHLTTLSI
ncbi:MAG TPA: hypothetical protein VG326_17135, partial [Tepidisphaeraceae bacterium]|nr:hypothetical protein [Tepidisphaeraceae bacterium]